MGSPSFPEFLSKYTDRLKEADFVYLSDTALPNENQVVDHVRPARSRPP